MATPSFTRRTRGTRWVLAYALAALVLCLIWATASRLLVPNIIESAYEERSVAFLNDVISGRAENSLAEYRSSWRRFTGIADIWLAALLGLGFIAGLFRVGTRVSEALARREARERELGPRFFSPGETILVAACFGLFVGAIVGVFVGALGFQFGVVLAGWRPVSVDVLWMAAAGELLGFVTVGVLLAAIGLLARPFRSRRVVLAILCTLAALTLLMTIERLQFYAALVLAAGVGVNAGRSLSVCWGVAGRRIARVAAGVAVCVPLTAMALSIAENRARQRLLGMSAAPSGAPNIVLLILDTVRAENLSLYGYERPTTPTLDALASEALVFDRAIAPASWTLPSHAAMLTGHYNVTAGTGFSSPLDGTYPTVPEVLSDRGYLTLASVANLIYATELFGLGRGFAFFDAHPRSIQQTVRSTLLTGKAYGLLRQRMGNHRSLVKKTAREVNREFFDRVDGNGDRPFFAMLNYFDAHAPYQPPEPYRTRFWAGTAEPRFWLGPARTISSEELDQIVSSYDGAIAYVDAAVAELVEGLRVRGQLDETILIITSDHGESFLEHQWLGHARSAHMTEVHVPLMIRYPGAVPSGTREDAPVSLRDLPVTMFDLAGLERGPFPGRSLRRLWDESARPDLDALGPGVGSDAVLSEIPPQRGSARSLVAGRYNLINVGGGYQLYDYLADPREQVNLLAHGDSALGDRLREDMIRALAAEAALPEVLGREEEGSR